MNYGLYTAFLGMRSRQRTLEVQADNIANSSTTGFKAERLLYSAIELAQKSKSDKQNLIAGVGTSSGTDFTAGTTQQTGRSLDVAIEGDAFIEVQTAKGARYTRAGNFSLDSRGQLVTKNGDLVVGERGPITIPPGAVSIGSDGTLSAGGPVINKIKLVHFNDPGAALKKEGDSLFVPTGSEQPQVNVNSRVIQGALESSNVNSVSEMVAMINNNREFESLQKSVTMMMSDIGRRISSEIGKI